VQIEIVLGPAPISQPQLWLKPAGKETGSLVEFFGLVRETEGEGQIGGLQYEAYEAMAERIIREKITHLAEKYPCQAIRVVHRLGFVPVGESAIYVGIRSKHRREGFIFLQEFMDEFKKDVPIWKGAA
jgi:molybdopterin synthase catalytic subunit